MSTYASKPPGIGEDSSEAPQARSWPLLADWQSYRDPFEQQWHLNLSYLIGKHYVIWNQATKRLEDMIRREVASTVSNPAGKNKARVVSNHVFRLFRQKLAEFLKLKMQVQIESATEDASDLAASKTGGAIVKYLQRKHKFQTTERLLWLLKMCFGHASLYPCWNPDAGPAGQEELHLLTPFETYWPRTRWPLPNQEVLIVRARPAEELTQQYGVKVNPDSSLISSPIEQQIRYLLEQREDLSPDQGMARELIHYKLPCPSYPKGLYRVETEAQVLHEGPMQPWYFDDEGMAHLPAIKFNFYDVPLSNFPRAFIDDLISPQREYNFKVSRITDHFQKLTGKWLIPFGAGLREPINDDSGQYLYYDPMAGATPMASTVPGLPASIFQDLARAKLDMEDLAGSHDISHGKVPSGVRSGKAIQALQEGDESQMVPIILDHETQMAEVFMVLLNIVKLNYQEPRTIDVVGDGKRYQLSNFTGQQLIGQKTITVTMGSAYPFSKVARQAAIEEQFKLGIITRDEARQQLQLAEDTTLPDNVDLLAAKAAVESMLKGILVEVHDFDNHALYIKVLNEVRKDPSFQATAKPDVKMVFDLVADLHMQALAKELQAQAAGPMAGAPPAGAPQPGMRPQPAAA